MRVSPMFMIIAIIVIMIPLMVFSSVKSRKRKNAELAKYKKMTGRVTAKVLNRKMVRERWHQGMDDEEEWYKCYIDYEFVVDGKTYRGNGEGSGAVWKKHNQVVCYDPDNPENNCPKYYYDSKMDTGTGAILITIVIVIAVFAAGFIVLKNNGMI